MKLLKKILRILFAVFLILLLAIYILFYRFTAPKSDEDVMASYQENGVAIELTHEKYKNFEYRKIESFKDTVFPTIVFVHGTIGSVMDFQKYFADSLLANQVNMIAYDRIGYNYRDKHPVQESISFEMEMLSSITKDIPSDRLILVGYSYGGPIVLALKRKIKKTVLLAPAVYSEVEPMPAMLNLYKWKLTRWLVPPIWKEASKEKISHPKDLKSFEKNWNQNPNDILLVHGNTDWIVPYSNSEYLMKLFPKEQIELVTLQNANHDLIWSNFQTIKNLLLKQLN